MCIKYTHTHKIYTHFIHIKHTHIQYFGINKLKYGILKKN